MDYGALLTESKWNIIRNLSETEQTPTELAEKTNTSLANISQQLRLLEAYGIVIKERRGSMKKPGKPRTIFSLGKEINHIISISNFGAVKKNLELDYFQKAILNILLVNKGLSYYLEKFFIEKDEVIKKCDAIGLIPTQDEKIELLLITDHVQNIRDKYSNQDIENLEGEKKTIICWTHSIKEIEEGIKSKNEHFIKLIEHIIPIMNKNHILENIVKINNEKNT